MKSMKRKKNNLQPNNKILFLIYVKIIQFFELQIKDIYKPILEMMLGIWKMMLYQFFQVFVA